MTVTLTPASRSALSRARFFLEKAKACPAEARVDFEAFLEAVIVFARAALHRMQKKYERHSKWQAWWDSLKGNTSVEFFRTQRNLILKETSLKAGQKIFPESVGSIEPSYSPWGAAELYYLYDPDVPATSTIEGHLNNLEELLAQGERHFIGGGKT